MERHLMETKFSTGKDEEMDDDGAEPTTASSRKHTYTSRRNAVFVIVVLSVVVVSICAFVAVMLSTETNYCSKTKDCNSENGLVCIDGSCQNPCDNACGNNTDCRVSHNSAVCTCKHKHFGDPLSGCEFKASGCYDNEGCTQGRVCVDGSCQNPCDNACGNNTDCQVSHNSAVCTCEYKHFGDPLSGCEPREDGCNSNSDCGEGTVCVDGFCKNPCDNACGNNTNCEVKNNFAICTCKENTFGNPSTGCEAKFNGCYENKACTADEVCVDGSCQNPCDNACGNNTDCRVSHNSAVCTCKHKHFGDPLSGCQFRTDGCNVNKECTEDSVCVDGSCQNPCDNTCGNNTDCRVSHNSAVCTCKDNYFGDPLSGCELTCAGPKCKTQTTSGYAYLQLQPLPEATSRGDLQLRFMVATNKDAHILLSPTPQRQGQDSEYEVVLGAGANTFSDIRRNRRGNNNTSTLNIVSETEARGFWIKMTREGELSVGKKGEDKPFMQWNDSRPLQIKYYSFSSWSRSTAKWFYDCID